MQQRTLDEGEVANGSMLDTNTNVRMTIEPDSSEFLQTNDSVGMEGN